MVVLYPNEEPAIFAQPLEKVKLANGEWVQCNNSEDIQHFCTLITARVAEYKDHATGSRADRTQFQSLMRDTSQRRFDVIVFWALDRFEREGALQTIQDLNLFSSYAVLSIVNRTYLDS